MFGLPDVFDDILGKFDLLDIIETYIRLAITPVSHKAKHGRFDTVLVKFPIDRPDQEIVECAGTAVRHLRQHGVVCGCVGFDSRYTYWLIRRSQIEWALWLLNGTFGMTPIALPKRSWKDRRRR